MSESGIIMVKVMCADETEALGIARALLEERLIACANILGPAKSVFRWRGGVETETECMLLMKTQEKHTQLVAGMVAELHSYELPEVSTLPISGGSAEYMNWIIQETENA